MAGPLSSKLDSNPVTFRARVTIGRTITAIVETADLNLARKSATLRSRGSMKEKLVIDGEACVPVRSRL